MKIVITAQGPELDSAVDPRFGRAAYFLVYDLDADTCEAVSNETGRSAGQGAGVQAAQLVASQAWAPCSPETAAPSSPASRFREGRHLHGCRGNGRRGRRGFPQRLHGQGRRAECGRTLVVNLTLAVASGKGGTGKTTLSANLAATAAAEAYKVQLCDCDVEEPRASLVKPTFREEKTVSLPCPSSIRISASTVDAAPRSANTTPSRPCPTVRSSSRNCATPAPAAGWCAPSRRSRRARVRSASWRSASPAASPFPMGRLHVGVTQVPPLIDAVKETRIPEGLVILDAPPGATCPVVATLKGATWFCW